MLFMMSRIKKDRIASVLDGLENYYGEVKYASRFEPMDELISCILSQHTSDANSYPAFARLKQAYPDWGDMVEAGSEKIAEVVKSAGLANQKSKAIVKVLHEIKSRNGDYTIENLRQMSVTNARTWLESLPSVGPKTSSIVLCFSFAKHAIPVDTHVFRVSKRLGFISDLVNENKAHDVLLNLVSEMDAFRYHVLLIQHGRHLCKARKPLCIVCPISADCKWKDKAK